MKKQQKLYLNNVLPVLICVGLAASGCARGDGNSGGSKAAVNVVGFKTLEQDITDTIRMVGSLEADESIQIKSEIDGTIELINFKEGQKVEKGDILIQIEKEKLQAAYDQAAADLRLASTTATRYEKLVGSKAVSQQEYDETKAALDSARAAKMLAKERLEDATIKAPFDGVMGERLISSGQYISQGVSLTYLYSQDPIRVEFHVPERFLKEIKAGQTVKLNVAAYKDKEYEGKVYFINPKVDEFTRTALIKAYVPNFKGELFDGMFANVNLIIAIKEDALVIPETALIIKGDEVFVYTIKDDETVELRAIKISKRFDGLAVIESGLMREEVVVTEGYQKFGPGAKVNVRLEEHSQKQLYEII